MQLSEYAAATAIVTSATLKMSIERRWPYLQEQDRELIFIDVLDRIARMRGWSIRHEPIPTEDVGE
jgi:hypothetical protein